MKTILSNSYKNKTKKVSVAVKTTPLTRSSQPTSIPLNYNQGVPSDSSHHHESINATAYFPEDGGSVVASGTVDDEVTMTVNGVAATPASGSGAVHAFNMSVSDLKAGYHSVCLNHTNINDYPNPPGNVSILTGSINVVDSAPEPNENEMTCDVDNSCECGDTNTNNGGAYIIATRSAAVTNEGASSFLRSTSSSSTSSAGRSTSAQITHQALRWSTSFATFRGLGTIPDGQLAIVAPQFSESLLSPDSLVFKHPLAASLLTEDEEGIAPNKALRLYLGADYTNYICDAQGYQAFAIGSSKSQTQRLEFVESISLESGDNLKTLDEANYLRVCKSDGSALFFNVPDAELVAYISSDGYVLNNINSLQYLVTIRDEETGTIRQIVNYWDGLADIVPASDGGLGYCIRLFTNSQVGDFDEESGLYPTTGSPFKEFIVSGDVEEKRITIEELDYSITLNVEPNTTSWIEENDTWSIVRGTGTDAITEHFEREELPERDDDLPTYRLVQTLSKMNSLGEVLIANRQASDYISTVVGELEIQTIEGYGSDLERITTREYDLYTGQLNSVVSPDGKEVKYSYDLRGRQYIISEPWSSGCRVNTMTTYVDDGSSFAEEIASRSITRYAEDGNATTILTSTYTYSLENSLKRVEKRDVAAGSTTTQLSVTETWQADSANIYARGRTRMTQAVNGVQTWYEYEATSLYDSLYSVTQETRIDGEVVAGKSTRNVSYISADGNTMREEQYVLLSDSSWVLTSGTTYSYDVQNRQVATMSDNGRSSSRELMCSGQALWEIDENGIRTDYAYDTARTLIETTRSETATTPETITEWTKDAAGRTLTTKQFVGAMETSSSTEYDALGRTISQTDTLGRVTSTSYSEDGLTVTTTSPSGATFINRNNTDGSVAEQSGTGQRHLTYTYDISGNNLRQIVRLAEDNTILSQQVSNGFGQVLTMGAATTQSDYHIYTRSTYNALGQKTQEQTGDMAPIVISYDSFGNQIKQVVVLDSSNPDSVTANRVTEQSTSFESLENSIYQVSTSTRYNAEGTALTSTQKQLISKLSETIERHSISIDERGLTTESQTNYGESLMERLQTSTVPTSDSVATATIVDGFTTAQTDQLGGSYSFTRQYTSTGITSTVTDPRGNTVTQKTDIAGRTIEQIDAAGNSTQTTYCDCCNKPASITDALGNVITYSYDARGRKVAENGTGIYPATYSYDDADRMISHSTYRDDQADTTSYSYDAATGFLLSTTYPDGTAETRLYNTMNLLGHLYNARGADCIHTYNTLTGDLLKQNYTDDTPDITYTYNHLGQVTSITDAAGTRTFSYNEYSELESDTSSINTTSIQVTESYDEMGRSNGYSFIKGSENVQIVAQGYDSKGRIGSASFIHSGASKEFTYNYLEGTSLLQSLVHPNGITTINTYEANRNLVTDINDARSTTSVVERGYTYDELGRPITRRIARKGTVRNDSFSYDTKSQLTAATMGSDDYAYDYDNIGNRKTAQEIADEITYDTNACNQYTTISDFTPEFDLDGNQTKLQTATGIWNITYNAANRPTTFTSEDGNTVIECAYDNMGRRITKKVTTNGSVTLNQRYIYRGYLQIAALDLTRTALSSLHLITWNPAEQTATRPLALQISGTWFTYGHDLSKNVTELFTTAGGVETCYTYSPFGAVTEDGDTTSPTQWSSEAYDSELALVYYNYRHYNPADGRWINRDPIGIQGGLNLYGFVGNRVWIWDVWGLKSRKIRVDVESWGDNKGCCHIHVDGDKYYYYSDKSTPGFYDKNGNPLPKDLRKELAKSDSSLARDVKRKLTQVNNRGGLASKFGGGKACLGVSITLFFSDFPDLSKKYIDAIKDKDLKALDNAYYELIESIPEVMSLSLMKSYIYTQTKSIHDSIRNDLR